MYLLISEWDIGEGRLIFASKESCINWLHNHSEIQELAAEEKSSVEDWVSECFYQGYFNLCEVQVI
jgi:hypothetical protein